MKLDPDPPGDIDSYYLYDGLGSTTGLTDDGGAVTDSYRYDAFGALRGSTGTSEQPFRFTGEQQDPDVANDLYYLRARYYDPLIGRFWTEDPIAGGHLYTYAGNNPVMYVDPYGLWVHDNVGDFVSGVGNTVGYAWDYAVSGPWSYTKVIQLLDLAPIAEGCAVGGFIAGAWTGGGALITGAAAYGFCDYFIEPLIGVLAGYATQIQIANSGCNIQRKRGASVWNLLSVGVDRPFNVPFADEVTDISLFVAGNELLKCNGKE